MSHPFDSCNSLEELQPQFNQFAPFGQISLFAPFAQSFCENDFGELSDVIGDEGPEAWIEELKYKMRVWLASTLEEELNELYLEPNSNEHQRISQLLEHTDQQMAGDYERLMNSLELYVTLRNHLN